MSKVGIFGTSVTTELQLNFIPEFIQFNNLSSSFSKLVVEADDLGTLVNLDANGILTFGLGETAQDDLISSSGSGQLRLTNGKIPLQGNNCRFNGTNGPLNNIDVFQSSDQPMAENPVIFKKSMVTALANSELRLNNFWQLGLYNIDPVNDIVTIEFSNGHTEAKYSTAQLGFLYGRSGAGITEPIDLASPETNTLPSLLTNFEGEIESVSIIPTADRTIYLDRIVSVYDL